MRRRKLIQMLNEYDEETIESKREELKIKLFKKFGTNKKCFRCRSQLLKSDLPSYKYLCLECDENMYKFEAI